MTIRTFFIPRVATAIIFLLCFQGASFANSETRTHPKKSEPKMGIPTTILLLDEARREIFVLPPDGVKPTTPTGFFTMRPATPLHTGAPVEKANATDTPLSERITHFASVAQQKLGTLKLDSAWAENVVSFVAASGNLTASASTPKTSWPPLVNFSASTLRGQNGQILVFVVRDSGKLGLLDKLDFIRINGTAKPDRIYWSRALNDPTDSEIATNIIEKVATQYQKIMRTEQTKLSENSMLLVFDKRIGERNVLTTEAALKEIVAKGTEAILIPAEVTQSEVRYKTPLDIGKFAAFAARLKDLDAKLTATRQGETNIVTIQVQGLP